MGKGGDVSGLAVAPQQQPVSSQPAAPPKGVQRASDGYSPSVDAATVPARPTSRLSGWRERVEGAGSKRSGSGEGGDGEQCGSALRPVRPRLSSPPLSDRARLQIAVQEAVRLAPEDVRGGESEDDEGDGGRVGPQTAPSGAFPRGGRQGTRLPGVLLAAPPGTLTVTPPASDGQPVDDTLWGVAPLPAGAATARASQPPPPAEPVLAATDLCGDGTEADVPHGSLCVPLLRHQRRALAWMQIRESGVTSPVGGLLADDQGLGKTLTAISLIVSCRPPPRPSISSRPAASAAGASGGLLHGVPGGTLVVVPTSVLRQWARELTTRVSSSCALTVLLYHGPGRTRSVADVARADVVLTTYAIVSQELGHRAAAVAAAASAPAAVPPQRSNTGAAPATAGEHGTAGDAAHGGTGAAPSAKAPGVSTSAGGGVLGAITWWRVILDEAQTIKNSRSLVAACVWALLARRRWCLSGTPLQNSVDDLFAYFRFLRHGPYDEPAGFRVAVKEPIRLNPTAGFAHLHGVLAAVMLRRTKATLIAGEPIVKLPPRHVALRCVQFSDVEREAYTTLREQYAVRFAEYRAAGTVSTNYVNILYMLLRLRQACNHVALVRGGAGDAAHAVTSASDQQQAPPPASEVASALKLSEQARSVLLTAAEGLGECPLCADCPEDAVVSSCGALFCRQCWATHVAISSTVQATGAGAAALSDDEREACPACGAMHAQADAYSPAALRMASGSKTAAAQTMHHPASLPAAGGEGGAIMSCKLRAVIDYLNDLRTRSGGVRPSEALRRAASGAQLAAASGGGGTGSALNKKERVRERNQTLRDGIRSSDAALAAALPPLPPVSFTSSRAIGTAALVGGSVASAVAEPPEKVIVFSQWTGTLDLLEPALRAEGFDFRRLDGTMSLAAREKALLEFETCPGVSVMLMSLKAAGLGVNLVCANHVLLLDVWWNPTVEEQAIDRSHRIGQRRPVHVCRLTVADTVEARILALQEHKRALAAAAFGEAHAGGAHGAGATGEEGGTSAADAAADAHRSRLTVEDLLFLFD